MMSRLQLAVEQIVFARNYTIRLDQTKVADWFRQPPGGVTHIAWQVGHLAMAQYRLCLEPIRGVRPEDDDVISKEFVALFARDSVPDADPAKYPSPSDIRFVFDGVYQQSLKEIQGLEDSDLDRPVL